MKIILVGFMGSGKTVVGKSLADKLNINFIDMDKEIEDRENKSISKVFEIHGEKYFRQKERSLLIELIAKDNVVISTGGGIVVSDENIEILKNEKEVIFLDATPQTIKSNVLKEINKRPLLKDSKDIDKTITDLLESRYNKYKSVYDIKVNVDNKNINQVVSEILVTIR